MTDTAVLTETGPRNFASRPARARARAAQAVLLLGLVVTPLAAWHEGKAPGSYASRVEVVFLAPSSAVNPNALAVSSVSVITTAGVVGRTVDPHVQLFASDAVSITDRGVRHGYSVALPDTGGQYTTNFETPALDVQAVGSTAAETLRTMRRLVTRIRSVLAHLQAGQHVAPRNAITTSESPPTIPLYYEGGSSHRAMAATLLLGCGLSLAAAAAVRRLTGPRPST